MDTQIAIEQYSELSTEELIEKFTEETLSLESFINQTNQLCRLRDLLQLGVNKEIAIGLESINPGCISNKITLNSFTQELSNTNYDIAVEGWMETAIQIFMAIIKNWKYIIPIIVAFWLKFKDPFKWFSSTDNGSSKLTNDVIRELELKLVKLRERGVTDKKDSGKGKPYIGDLEEYEKTIKARWNTELDKDLILKSDFIGSNGGNADIKALTTSLKNCAELSEEVLSIFTQITDDLKEFSSTVLTKVSDDNKDILNKAQDQLSEIEHNNYQPTSDLISLSKICRSYKLMGDRLTKGGGARPPISSKRYHDDSGKVEYIEDSNGVFWANKFDPDNIISDGLYSSGKDTTVSGELTFQILHHIKNFTSEQLKDIGSAVTKTSTFNSKLLKILNEMEAIANDYKKSVDDKVTIHWPKNSINTINLNNIPLNVLNRSNVLSKNVMDASMKVANDIKLIIERLNKMATDKKNYADKINAVYKQLNE